MRQVLLSHSFRKVNHSYLWRRCGADLLRRDIIRETLHEIHNVLPSRWVNMPELVSQHACYIDIVQV
jgi:hypothetical protein